MRDEESRLQAVEMTKGGYAALFFARVTVKRKYLFSS